MFEDVGSIAAFKRKREPQTSEPGKIFSKMPSPFLSLASYVILVSLPTFSELQLSHL